MKVIVLWENSTEQALATNLVAVLRKIGAMLVYGKVNDKGVLLEDWQSKPKVKMECVATPAPSAIGVEFGPPLRALPGPSDGVSYTYEMDYVDGVGYRAPVFTMQDNPGTLSVTRELMRDLVRMFPNDGDQGTDKAIDKTKKRKPVVPKPNTTKTGVTVRQLDMWEEDDHGNHTDQ